MPHHPVIKYANSKISKIRPVSDGGFCGGGGFSLNMCLEKGPNLIPLIPDVLDRFRSYKIGLTNDIANAFLEISVCPTQRKYLRFFFPSRPSEEGSEGDNLLMYQHARLPFGLTCSPFILTAVIDDLLESRSHLDGGDEIKGVICKLRKSFYVDDLLSGVGNEEDIPFFMDTTQNILKSACFNLKGWNCNIKTDLANCSGTIGLLGLNWNLDSDLISCKIPEIMVKETDLVTKRMVLSVMQKIFDPMGIISAVILLPKIWLQELWKIKGLKWDEAIPSLIEKKFRKWASEIFLLKEISIPRYNYMNENSELHVFVDASRLAYSACIYIRTETSMGVKLNLLRAKSRVSPIKEITIPRLELMACLIGSRLANSIKIGLELSDIRITYWSDSQVALWWIKNSGEWSIFIANRVKEINLLTDKNDWRFVPGLCNPADIISRGCTPAQLLKSKWHEGPEWLLKASDTWPDQIISCDTDQVNSERKKVSHCNVIMEEHKPWYETKFSNFHTMLRVITWVKRFINNCRTSVENRKSGELSISEIKNAEICIIRSVQNDFFPAGVPNINTFFDSDNLLCVRTKITERNDEDNFKSPIVLPSECVFTRKLIEFNHNNNCHAGTHMLISILRENYWILRARKTVRKIVKRCVKCRRFAAKPHISEPVALPKDRVEIDKIFQTIGVDLAGPLFLKNREKVWIALFTCANFRAVHLELVNSLSTDTFLLALRRFIARRGRPVTIYSDNATNFRGASRELNELNWDKIISETSIQKIKWKFNPPTGSWYGGFFERLIGIVKGLLRRTLGNAVLTHEELQTVLCDCESIINARPLTYLSEDPEDLAPLTPAMFLMHNSSSCVSDIDQVDAWKFNKRIKYRLKLIQDLRCRFRKEYLGALVQKNTGNNYHNFKVGEIVLIGDDLHKRIDWPLAKIVELLPGRDGKIRCVKVKCRNNILIRPIQRIYSLEIPVPLPEKEPEKETSTTEGKETSPLNQEVVDATVGVSPPDIIAEKTKSKQPVKTRHGRIVNPPDRLGVLKK